MGLNWKVSSRSIGVLCTKAASSAEVFGPNVTLFFRPLDKCAQGAASSAAPAKPGQPDPILLAYGEELPLEHCTEGADESDDGGARRLLRSHAAAAAAAGPNCGFKRAAYQVWLHRWLLTWAPQRAQACSGGHFVGLDCGLKRSADLIESLGGFLLGRSCGFKRAAYQVRLRRCPLDMGSIPCCKVD